MKSANVNLEIHSWWHPGSGEAGAGDVDAAVRRDRSGLPYFPGKTLQGLFRAAAFQWAAFGSGSCEQIERLFGRECPPAWDTGGQPSSSFTGLLCFSNAELLPDFRAWVGTAQGRRELPALFEVLANTALNKDGVAVEHSLRRAEVVMPCRLEATVSWPTDEELKDTLNAIARWIRRLGLHRHRGLGRCNVTVR
jgi:CRISPR/Cas system CSM-associated protein Csm3 (group 7 of RAMP superfamily)